MNKQIAIVLASLACAATAEAEEVRVHAAAGAAHAVGGTQQREFGPGGGGSATIELPVSGALGVQAGAGAVALAKGDAPAAPGVAPQSTGTAVLGTVGVRVRPLAGRMVAGPWVDANGGFAQTGDRPRAALDAHVGWDFRVSREGRWDVGPFVGYTQIVQPDGALRSDDARILWVGVQVSLGAREHREAPPPSAAFREPPPAPVTLDADGLAEAVDLCPDDPEAPPESGCGGDVRLVDDRIVLDDVIHFEFDSPRIQRWSRPLVRKIAKVILETPDIVEVEIEGHADAVGTAAYNQRLSEARAESTRAMLIEFGVPEAQLKAVGFGKSHPKFRTRGRDGRNRRVEFVVSRTHKEIVAASSLAKGKEGAR